MKGIVDLHIHSNKSCDGDYTPRELIGFAKEKGLAAISITDHDTMAAYPEVLKDGEEAGVEIIPGIEVTTLFDDREFHVLLFFLDWKSASLGDIIGRMTKSRFIEARERVDRLQECGIDLTWREVEEKSGSCAPLGVKIAQILLDKPESNRNPLLSKYFEMDNKPFGPYVFYRDFFMEGKPAFVPKRHIPLLEVLSLAPRMGGVPVLSHPGAYFQQTTQKDLETLKSKGLAGIEVFTFYHTPAQIEFYSRLAGELDLVPTAGSDFHGRIKPHVEFGALSDGHYGMVEELRQRRPQ